MHTTTERSSADDPVFRVWLCGAFHVEKRVGERYELIHTADWGGSNYPRLLLKALLCCPGRQARRDTLLDLLWPEADFEQATAYLNTATSKLRLLLRPAKGQESLLFTENDATLYRLAAQSLLWVDAEEGVALFKEAERRGRTSPEALPLLEQAATYFTQGSLLPEEEGLWATGRRASVEQVRASCRLWLVEAYAHHGLPGQAVTVLQTLLEEDPLDEDVLVRLMDLLHQQGMTHQALRLYEQSCEVLAREELEPSEATRELAARLRKERHFSSLVSADSAQIVPHQGALQMLFDPSNNTTSSPPVPQTSMEETGLELESALQIQHKPVALPREGSQNGEESPLPLQSFLIHNTASNLLISGDDSQAMIPLTTAHRQHEEVLFSLSAEQFAFLSLPGLGLGDEAMAFDPSKRDLLQKIATALLAAAGSSTLEPFMTADPEPWERLLMAQRKQSPSAAINAATLDHFEQLLAISWQLCDENQFNTAEGILVSFLPLLLSLPQHEPRTASLASHGLRLQSILVHHRSRLDEKVRLCEQSVSYARLAENANTLVPALIELAGAYEYGKQPEKRLQALQEALYYSGQASSLVQSRVYSRYAVALAESKRIREAQFYIGLAQEVFPDDPMKDPGFALADSNIFRFSYHAGLVSLYTDSITQAFPAFEYYKQHSPSTTIPERVRLEIANGKSKAAILLNDAEQYADLLENVIIGSINIKSRKRFGEAYSIFRKEMPQSWLTIPCIKTLSEQYNLRRED